jgi:lysozyme family protein
MLPLIPLAISVVPELIKLIAGDKAGAVANQVAGVVQAVTGTTDPVEAQKKLAEDPALVTTLRVRLAEIALESQKAQLLAEEQQRQAELAGLQKTLENTQGARGSLVDLVRAGSPIAWGAPVVSIIVTGGFFVFLALLVLGGARLTVENPTVANIVNIAVGALATAFATVVNFWLGSSQGSRNKDETVAQLQAAQIEMHRTTLERAAAPSPPPPAKPANGDALFEQCLAIVLDKEGGFSDHPQDKGGPTNLGITWRTFAQWKGLNPDEQTEAGRAALVEELKALNRREAAEIYRANYWLPMRCGDLPPAAALMVFDFGVNAGPKTAVQLLQRVAGVTADGSVGPMTLAAVRALDAGRLVDQLAEARLAHYRGLPDFATFGAGWAARTEQVASLARALRT